MTVNILFWLGLVAVTLLFAWLVTRAWRARRWFVRLPAVFLSGVLTLTFAALSVIGAIGLFRLYFPGGTPVQILAVEATPERIARGEHIANAFCVECHSPSGQMPMAGGVDLAKDIPLPMGSFVSANLTPGGSLKNWTDGEILRVLREGVDRDGRRTFVMDSINTRYLSDEDLLSVIAFLRSQPSVAQSPAEPLDRPNLLGVLLTGAGVIPSLPPVSAPISAPPKGPTAEYGKYVLSYNDCQSCHGETLNGGTSKIFPVGPSLRVVKSWTQEQFISTLRTGMNPTGRKLQPPMPWKSVGRMDDDELGGLYQYIVSLP